MAFINLVSGGSIQQRPDDLSNHRHRQLIGYIGLVFPMLLIAIVLWRDGLEVWKELESVSAYYYTGAVPVFVGMLVSLALFLFTYDGYGNEHHTADRCLAIVAAIAAAGVAFFPTAAPNEALRPTWWSPWIGVVHYVCAVVLFAAFAAFCLWLFRQRDGVEDDPDKETRNTVYAVCGVVIIASMGWAGYLGSQGKPIFWPESMALVFFAISWLVKGYALRSIAAVAQSWIPGHALTDDEEKPVAHGP